LLTIIEGVTGSERGEADEAGVMWLTAGELDSWLSVVRLMTWLPWSIDQQLQRDSKLGMVEYQVLAVLSESPERTKRMSLLAEVTNASLSRLSRVVNRLAERGLVRREPDPTDGRFTNAILTDDGFRALADAAPGHCGSLAATQSGSWGASTLLRSTEGATTDRQWGMELHVAGQRRHHGFGR
jgi:DNA-binding MarR family transcriptional regulator